LYITITTLTERKIILSSVFEKYQFAAVLIHYEAKFT